MLATSRLLVPLLSATGISLAAWFVLLGVLAVATRPREVEPGPAVMDLGGPESPAVVNFLVNDCRATPSAVPATVLDLAARGYLDLDQTSPGEYACRLRSGPDGAAALEPYELQVLDHLRSVAVEGVVPCRALTTGPQERSQAWWKRFSSAVVADARRRGLSRDRWGRGMLVVLGVGALVPAALATAVLALVAADQRRSSSSSDSGNPLGWLGMVLVLWTVLMSVVWSLRNQRQTPDGIATEARWLGLRRLLQDDGQFPSLPPSAVAMWDRYLGYGAAMGVAAAAVAALPLGAESDDSAWSAHGGRWHEVRVRYPRRLGWGKHPVAVAVGGLMLAAGSAGVGRFLLSVADAATRLPSLRGADGSLRWEVVFLMAVLGALGTGVLAAFVYGVALAWRALPDVGRRREVEGRALRVRTRNERSYLAVDEGQAEVRAWVLRPQLPSVAEGDMVRAVVSPRLGHVYELDAVSPAAPAPPAEPAEPAEPATDPMAVAAGVVDDADVASVTGRTLERVASERGEGGPLPGPSRSWSWTDRGRPAVIVWVRPDDDGAARSSEDRVESSRVLRGLVRPQAVAGMGGKATWYRTSTLVVHDGGFAVSVTVRFRDVPPARRLEMAQALATLVLSRLDRGGLRDAPAG